MMKKIIGLLAVAGLVIIGIFGFKYYHETYQGVTAYGIVPTKVPEKQATKDNTGKVQTGLYSYKYTIHFVTEDGKADTRSIEVTGENPIPLEPDGYIKVKLSQKRILEGPNNVEKADIPAKVLDKLN